MFTTCNNPFSRFINLLDTPADYESGKLLIFDVDKQKVIAVDLGDVPSLVEGVRRALIDLLADSDTVEFDIDTTVRAIVRARSLTPSHINSLNPPYENAVLTYTGGHFIWASPDTQTITIEAKEDINALQPVTIHGYVARNNLPVTNKALGLALNSANSGDSVQVIYEGRVINVTWSWSPGSSIYLGDGDITDIPPNTGGKFLQKLGEAITEDIIFLSIDQTIVIL